MPFDPALLLFAASSGAHVDPATPVILALAMILAVAKLAGALAVRLGQPEVLGELLAGILLGSLDLLGAPWFRFISFSGRR